MILLKSILYLSLNPLTSASVNPIKEANGPGFNIVYSSKLFNADWVIVRDGKIEMRGNGGDQNPRVKVTEGQKVYFNFMTGTGEII